MKQLMILLALLMFTPMAISIEITAGKVMASEVKGLINKAERTRQKAAKEGYEWTTTAGLIKEAKAALKKDDKSAAVILAKKALIEAKNSMKQAEFADLHWQDFEIK
jgi:hypothetical protein